MSAFPPTLTRVIQAFSRFPGIGNKTAQRLGFHLLKSDKETVMEMAQAFIDLKEKIRTCDNCYNIAEISPCEICSDTKRDHHTICVVEEAADIFIFEKTGYRGLYHVLGGVLSPLDGVGPDDLRFKELVERMANISELILGINASIEGETTTLYLKKLLQDSPVTITRLARGLPVGGQLEYVDEATLSRSLNERVKLKDG